MSLVKVLCGGFVVVLLVAACARPQLPVISDPILRDRMILCSAGVESAAKTSLQAAAAASALARIDPLLLVKSDPPSKQDFD